MPVAIAEVATIDLYGDVLVIQFVELKTRDSNVAWSVMALAMEQYSADLEAQG